MTRCCFTWKSHIFFLSVFLSIVTVPACQHLWFVDSSNSGWPAQHHCHCHCERNSYVDPNKITLILSCAIKIIQAIFSLIYKGTTISGILVIFSLDHKWVKYRIIFACISHASCQPKWCCQQLWCGTNLCLRESLSFWNQVWRDQRHVFAESGS